MERKRDLSWLKDGRVLTLCGGCVLAGFLIGMLIFGSPWHLPPAWGDIPTWITAIATTGLLIGAYFTALYAIKAFRKQSEEVAILVEQNREHQQALEDEADERHMEQASRVWVMLVPDDGATKRDFPSNRPIRKPAEADTGGPSLEAMVRKTSEHQVPIFHAKLHWYCGSEPYGTPNPELLLDMPGYENTARSRTFPPGTDLSTCGAFLTFHDAKGFGWMRAPGGVLTEHPPDELDEAARAAIGARTSPPRNGALSR